MTTAEISPGGLSDAEHRLQLRRAVVASTVGTVIEAYDFLLYGQVAGLVFAKLYFPGSDPLVGTLQAFAIYAVGFVARPVGAALFGEWGGAVLLSMEWARTTAHRGFIASWPQWGCAVTRRRFSSGCKAHPATAP